MTEEQWLFLVSAFWCLVGWTCGYMLAGARDRDCYTRDAAGRAEDWAKAYYTGYCAGKHDTRDEADWWKET